MRVPLSAADRRRHPQSRQSELTGLISRRYSLASAEALDAMSDHALATTTSNPADPCGDSDRRRCCPSHSILSQDRPPDQHCSDDSARCPKTRGCATFPPSTALGLSVRLDSRRARAESRLGQCSARAPPPEGFFLDTTLRLLLDVGAVDLFSSSSTGRAPSLPMPA